MKSSKFIYVISIIIFIAICFILIFSAYWILQLASVVISGASELAPNIYVPLTITVLTASLGLVATLYTQQLTRKREIEASHRERKIELYLEFLEVMDSFVENADKDPQTNDIGIARLKKAKTKATLYGSTAVLKAFKKLSRQGASTVELMDAVDELKRSMRRDLGLKTWDLEAGFFAKFMLSDPEEYDRLKSGTKK